MTPDQPCEKSQPAEQETVATEMQLSEEASRSWTRENRRMVVLALSVGVFMVIAHFTPLRAWITNVQVWKGHIRDLGWMAHVGFGLVCAGSVLVGIPRLPLCAAAGLVFGFGEGLLLSLIGSTAGSYGAFVAARLGGRRAVLARAMRWPWLEPLLKQPSMLRVFWVRQLMLPGIVLNVLLGVTAVRHRTFLMGTVLGYLPMNMAFTLVGSGLGKDSLARTLMQLMAAMGLINVLGWLMWRLLGERKV
jgi:uncharacterized membrane protein YdjX (TVP38/TMEM64 family)